MSRTWLWCFGALVAATGCSSALGPAFQPESVGGDQAIVYIYRPSRMKGSFYALPVRADGVDVGAVFNGSYVPYHVHPGAHVFSIRGSFGTHATKVTVAPGRTYYLRYEITMLDGSSLLEVPEKEGQDEVEDCQLLPGGYDASDSI